MVKINIQKVIFLVMKEDKIQGGMDWKRARLGKITASEISCLLKDRKEPMTEEELAAFKEANHKSRVTTKVVPFSDASFTYLNRKVLENYLPLNSKSVEAKNAVDEYIEEHSFSNAATRWGTLWEDTARNKYAEAMGYEVIEVGFIPYSKFPKLMGVSPDGMIREEKGGCEIKCPYTLEKHLQHLTYQTPQDLKENEEEYYWQIYANMLVTEADFWDFVSFNPYISKNLQLKILRIHRDENEINLLDERIALAVQYMKEKMQQLDNIQTIIK